MVGVSGSSPLGPTKFFGGAYLKLSHKNQLVKPVFELTVADQLLYHNREIRALSNRYSALAQSVEQMTVNH
jgi:hypothetical protein